MSELKSVPVVDVTKDNIAEVWPSLVLAVKTSLFVAIDLELSGIGNRKEINSKSVEDRYAAMTHVADTRAIISMGLSCFRQDARSAEKGPLMFTVQTFNILVLCQDNYIVEPSALQFLISHGFDFNRQYALGVPYRRGHDRTNQSEEKAHSLRKLFSLLVVHRKPIVFHNGFMDTVFLYHSFYLALPPTLQTFLADLNELFPSRVYDTKFIAETKASLPASYLEYVFRNRQRDNARKEAQGRQFIAVQFLQYNQEYSIDHGNCALRAEPAAKAAPDICKNFARYGWCGKGDRCCASHNVDDILDAQASKRRRRKRVKMSSNGDCANASDSEHSMRDLSVAEGDDDSSNNEEVNSGDSSERVSNGERRKFTTGLHRAGFDAFMTGYAFATFVLSYCRHRPSGNLDAEQLGLDEIVNRLCLSGKPAPLLIRTSNFAKHNPKHIEKFKALFGDK
uniref:Target of EGR1 protein 1 n=1 Tax=Amblyomma maculatum TaxID=34609 RepID=G3MS21_AMBMU